MIPINRTYAPLQAFVDELARCGVQRAVTCPGSRNAPLVLTLAADERIDAVSMLDERAGGFLALGMAKASGRPVAITCTSGTAAAELLPAVVEAREARVPLIVLTADRPPELRDVGAGQAIDQLRLYGSAAKWFCEVGNLDQGRDSAVHHRSLACRAYATAAGGRPGPVHLNFPLREPLAPVREELDASVWEGRPDGRPWVVVDRAAEAPTTEAVESLAQEIRGAERGAIVCGPAAGEAAGPVARLGAATGWPVLAEPTSGLRCGDHDRSHVVAHYDVLLRVDSFVHGHAPDLIVRVGDTPTSKPLRSWLASARQVVIDPHESWHEPTRQAERVVAAGAAETCAAVALSLGSEDAPDTGWLDSWRAADSLVPAALAELDDPFEPKVYAALAEAVPEGSTLWLSSSMPVRDVEAFFPQAAKPLRFLSNRGANGIDGVVSSAFGAARVSEGPTFLLTGELALLHDLSGLVAARRNGIELTIVCVNNGGGGIFDFLQVAEHADAELYERYIATPSDVDFGSVAGLAGLRHEIAITPGEVASAVSAGSGPALVEVKTDRADNVRLHREVVGQVAERLS